MHAAELHVHPLSIVAKELPVNITVAHGLGGVAVVTRVLGAASLVVLGGQHYGVDNQLWNLSLGTSEPSATNRQHVPSG